MKAEDTVMDEERMLGCSLRGKYCFDEVKDVILDTSIAQAKITWDKAIREVLTAIDWLGILDAEARDKLKPKLKEWGIK